MKILIDTHALLWLVTDSSKLTEYSKEQFLNSKNELFFSTASYWEICIKVSLGKLKVASNWDEVINEELRVNVIKWLPIKNEHCLEIVNLPFYHRDPFDRLLIAQAINEKMSIMTADEQFSNYPVKIIW